MDENATNVAHSGNRYPEWFGRFRVIAPLARGGMGQVYLVEDEAGRKAVVKTIRSELATDPSYRARSATRRRRRFVFGAPWSRRCWSVIRVLRSPGSPSRRSRVPRFARWFSRGTLIEHVRLSAFAADLAEGVHAFFDQGMSHGDLTPSNIVVQPGDRLKILDLGLARPTADETATDDLPAMGTPYWLAPEVAAGFAPDSLSDVNQWGKLVLFAGTGYPRRGPASLREALSELPDPLCPIVERCMSAVPDARPGPEELWRRTRVRRLSGKAPPSVVLTTAWLTLEPGDRWRQPQL